MQAGTHEEPTPAFEAVRAVKLEAGKREQAAEGVTDLRAAVQNGRA